MVHQNTYPMKMVHGTDMNICELSVVLTTLYIPILFMYVDKLMGSSPTNFLPSTPQGKTCC